MKINYKIISIIILAVMFVFNINKVEAFSIYGATIGITEGTPNANSLDNIPSTINLDIKESEFQKAQDIIIEQIVTELEKQGMKFEETGWTHAVTVSLSNLPSINKATIWVGTLNEYHEPEIDIIEREVTINYSNTANYNETDKNYVENVLENLSTAFPYYEIIRYVEIEDLIWGHDWDYNEQLLLQTINDPSITLVHNGFASFNGTGGLFPDSEKGYNVFKNDVYYQSIGAKSVVKGQITVPDDIEDTDTAYINYAIPKIREYLNNSPDSPRGDITLEKDSGYYYKVYINNTFIDDVIIKKSDGAHIGNNIYINNLPIGVNITAAKIEDDSMKEELESSGYTNILGFYEFKLEGTDKLETPIKITFNVGEEYNGKDICILNKANNEYLKETVEDGKVSTEISEISILSIAIEKEKLGDINGDTRIDALDAKLALQYFTGKEKLTAEEFARGDVTKDGTINALDAKEILRYFTGKISEFK